MFGVIFAMGLVVHFVSACGGFECGFVAGFFNGFQNFHFGNLSGIEHDFSGFAGEIHHGFMDTFLFFKVAFNVHDTRGAGHAADIEFNGGMVHEAASSMFSSITGVAGIWSEVLTTMVLNPSSSCGVMDELVSK